LNMSGWEASLWDLIEFRGDLVECGIFIGAPLVGRWTGGQSWSPLGNYSGWPMTMAKFRDRLYVGGGSQPTLSSWDGASWSPIAGTNHLVWDLLPHEGELLVAGEFTPAGTIPSPYLARWGCPCYSDCDNSGALAVADFGCFQTQFVASHPYTDCNSDGAFTVQDFGCFQSKFVAGCP
jgi:hypothetical protein